MPASTDTPSRMFGLVCVLILVWVGVYWLYQPTTPAAMPHQREPSSLTTMDTRPPPVQETPPPSAPPVAAAPKIEPIAAPAPPPQPEPVATEPREKVVPPKFRQIVVRAGDTSFEVIAARELGDRRKWDVIARANPFVTSDRLKPGKTVLNIPLDPGNIQGKVVVEGGSPQAASAAEPASASKPVETTYVVQADDTLWSIARKVYKRGSAWRTIYEANRDVIKDPDRPPPGATLKIPPAPKD